MKLSTTTALLVASILSAVEASYEKVAGYAPNSQVTDHCAVDRDQAAMETALADKTDEAFASAMKVYTEGGNSKSYALVALTGADGLTAAVAKGDAITGLDSTGGAVVGKAYSGYEAGATELKVQYKTTEIQDSYVNCQVGGLPADSTNTAGCFQAEGNLNITGTEYPYTYDPATDNNNGRTLQGFSTGAESKMAVNSDKCKGCPYDDHGYFNAYYGTPDYADQWVTAAFEGKATDFTNGNADFAQYGFPGRDQAIKKGTAYQSVFMYVIREFEDALDDCQKSCIDCNDDPVHAWDEGVCFYTGSLEGPDGAGSGKLLYGLADKRCGDYKTCGAAGGELTGTSQINTVLMQKFALGRDQLLQGKCDEARATTAEVTDLMYVPLIQGAMRYAYKVDVLEGGEKEQAEGLTFAAAVLPKVHHYNPTAAKAIYDNLKIGASDTTNFKDVKNAFETVYEDMNVECAHVGGLWNDGTADYYEGFEPCGVLTDDAEDSADSAASHSSPATLAVAALLVVKTLL